MADLQDLSSEYASKSTLSPFPESPRVSALIAPKVALLIQKDNRHPWLDLSGWKHFLERHQSSRGTNPSLQLRLKPFAASVPLLTTLLFVCLGVVRRRERVLLSSLCCPDSQCVAQDGLDFMAFCVLGLQKCTTSG